MSIYVIKLKGIMGDKRTTGNSIPDLGQTHVKCDVFTEICPKNSCYDSHISENDIAITLKSTVLHLWQDICLIRIS
jgi:hypothetical protein